MKKDEGLQIKLFHDILKGLKYRGYDMLVVGKDIFIPLKKGRVPRSGNYWSRNYCICAKKRTVCYHEHGQYDKIYAMVRVTK